MSMRVLKQSSNSAAIAVVILLAMAISAIAQQQAASPTSKPEASTESTKTIPAIHIANFGSINPNFYRGARPKVADYKDLAAMGIKTVINLERGGDRNAEKDAKAAGLNFFKIPMSDSATPADADVQKFLQLASDPAKLPIFVHCKGGRHRTGLVTAIYRMTYDGWTAEQSYQEMKKFDFSYGFGHGDLKRYVLTYSVPTPQPSIASETVNTGNHK